MEAARLSTQGSIVYLVFGWGLQTLQSTWIAIFIISIFCQSLFFRHTLDHQTPQYLCDMSTTDKQFAEFSVFDTQENLNNSIQFYVSSSTA